MGATEVLRWIEGAAAIVSLGLGALTLALAIKFKGEIKKAEKRRAVHKIRHYKHIEECEEKQHPVDLVAAGS
jgi:hypothetical protein